MLINIYKSQLVQDIIILLRSSVLAKAIQLIRGFVVAKYLTPEMFGIIDLVNRIKDFSKYGDFGFLSVVVNEYNYYVNDKDHQHKIVNIGFSAEIVLTFLSGIVVIIVSLFYLNDFVLFVGLLTSGLLIIVLRLIKIYYSFLQITKQFKLYANILLIGSFVLNILIIITVPFINVFSPLIIPILPQLFILYLLNKKVKGSISFKFQLNRNETWVMFKKGIVLSGLTIITGMAVYVERYVIIDHFGFKGAGLFAISFLFVIISRQILLDAAKPFIPRSKEALGNKNFDKLKKLVIIPTIIIVPIAIFFIIGLYYTVPWIISKWFEQYNGSISIFKILLPLIYLSSITAFSGYLLYSPGVNKLLWAYLSHISYIAIVIFLLYVVFRMNLTIELIAFVFCISNIIRSFIVSININSVLLKTRHSIFYSFSLYIYPIVYLYLIKNEYGY